MTFVCRLLVFLGLMLVAPAAHAVDAWVSPTGTGSACTVGTPCATIALASAVVTAGGFVNVIAGQYALAPFVTTKAGTGAGTQVTYRCTTAAGVYVRGGCIIKPAIGTAVSSILWENQGQFVTVMGFEIDGRAADGGTVRIGTYGSPTAVGPVIYQENHVHHIYQVSAALCNGSGGAGMDSDPFHILGAVVHFYGNIVHDVGPPAGCNTTHGIYFATIGDVKNNLVYRSAGWGIQGWHDTKNNNIINNTVFGNISGGIAVGAGDFYYTPAPASGTRVANNIVYSNSNFGIIENGSTDATNVYTNNLVNSSGTAYQLQNGLTATNGLTTAPVFVNFIAGGGGDYHLALGSPGINAGSATAAPATDLDGTARPQSAVFDMGAYEFTPSIPSGSGISFSTSGGTFTGDPLAGSYAIRVIGNVTGQSQQGSQINLVNNVVGAVAGQKFIRITSSGEWQVLSNGYNTLISAQDSGSYEGGAYADVHGNLNVSCYGNARFGAYGSSQTCTYALLQTTTAASAVRLTGDGLTAGATNCVNVAVNTASSFTARLAATNQTTRGTDYTWVLPNGRISKDATAASTTVAIGTPLVLSRGTVTGAAVALTADTTLGCLNWTFTPPTGNTSVWNISGTIELTETGQ